VRRRTTLFWGPSPNKHPIRPKREDPLGGSTDKERNAKRAAIVLTLTHHMGEGPYFFIGVTHYSYGEVKRLKKQIDSIHSFGHYDHCPFSLWPTGAAHSSGSVISYACLFLSARNEWKFDLIGNIVD